jgi:MFS family permease
MAEVTAERPEAGPAPALGWAATTFQAFRFRDYRTVWVGSFFAFLAVNMAGTAQGVVAYDLTGDNGAVGSVMFGQGIAMMFLNPFGGAIADRFPKRLLILISQLVIGGIMLTIALLITTGHISILFLALGSFIMGAMFAVLGPSRTALLGEVVSPGGIGNAMALLQVGGNFARIGAPLLATTLLILLGGAGTYFVIVGILVFVIVTMYQIPASAGRANRADTSVLDDVRIGIKYTREHPRLLHGVLSFYFITMLAMSSIVMMPGYAKSTLDSGTEGLGIIMAASAAGGFVLSLAVASQADSRHVQVLLTVSGLASGVGLILSGLAPNLPLAVLTMVVVMGGSSVFQTLNNSQLLKRAEPQFYGRLASLMMIAWGFVNVLSLPVGFLGDAVGERAALATLGSALCCVTLLFALWERRLSSRGA